MVEVSKPIAHHCHAFNCEVTVPERMFMCLRHWRMVSRVLQKAIWREYVPGQEIRKDPTPQYLEVAHLAIASVAKQEGYNQV